MEGIFRVFIAKLTLKCLVCIHTNLFLGFLAKEMATPSPRVFLNQALPR